MTDIVKVFRGRRGDKAPDGEDGTGVDDIRGSIVGNPVLDILYNNVQSKISPLTWDRVGEALNENRYGDFEWVSGEDITNFVEYSNDLTQWSDFFNRWTLDSTNNLDPFGGNTASYVSLDVTTVTDNRVMDFAVDGTPNIYHTLSFWFKVVSGTVTELEVKIGPDVFKVNANLDSNWQRVFLSPGTAGAGSLLSISPIGISGAVVGVFGVMFEDGSVLHDYIETTGSPVTVPSTESSARSNQLGYLIEGQKQNETINSEDLSQSNWTVSGALLSEYDQAGIFGDFFQNTRITFATNATGTITTTGAFTEGVEYTVSFFALLLSGNVTNFTCRIAGGVSVEFSDLSSEKYTRLTVKAIAGASGDLVFTIISPDLSADMILVGFQAEINGISSYIRSANALRTRPEDDVNLTYEIGRPDNQWSCFFKTSGVDDNSNIKKVFSNGLSGSDEFAVWLSDTSLNAKIGTVTSTFINALSSDDIGLTYDGANIIFYKNGLLNQTIANAGTVLAQPATLYVGGDETTGNNLNGYLQSFKFYNELLTGDEMRYLSGV